MLIITLMMYTCMLIITLIVYHFSHFMFQRNRPRLFVEITAYSMKIL